MLPISVDIDAPDGADFRQAQVMMAVAVPHKRMIPLTL
jgi:hypothetical protein